MQREWIRAVAKDPGGDAQENHDSLICHPETRAALSQSAAGPLRENSSTAPPVFFAPAKEDKLSEFIGIRCRGSMQNSADTNTLSEWEIRKNFPLRFLRFSLFLPLLFSPFN